MPGEGGGSTLSLETFQNPLLLHLIDPTQEQNRQSLRQGVDPPRPYSNRYCIGVEQNKRSEFKQNIQHV